MRILEKLANRLANLKQLNAARKTARQLENEATADPGSPLFSIGVDPLFYRRAVLEMFNNRIFSPSRLVQSKETHEFVQGRRLLSVAMDRTCRPVRFRGQGFVLEIPDSFPHAEKVVLNDFVEIFVENHYLAGFPYRAIEDNAIVLDCGANIGGFTVQAAQSAHNVRVIAFEPAPQIFPALARNVEINHLSQQVECLALGLSDKRQDKAFRVNFDCFTTSRFVDTTDIADGLSTGRTQQIIRCVTVDEIVSERSLSRCDFIKMDAEGSERQILQGASETIRHFRPRLSMAAYHFPDDVYILPTMIKKLRPDYNIVVSRKAHLYAF